LTYKYTSFNLSSDHLMHSCVTSTFGLVWVIPKWTFVYKFSVEVFSIFLGIYLGVKLLGHTVFLYLTFLRNNKLFQSNPTILHSQQQHMKTPTCPHPHQRFHCPFLITAIVVGVKCPSTQVKWALWFWFAFPWWLMMSSIFSWHSLLNVTVAVVHQKRNMVGSGIPIFGIYGCIRKIYLESQISFAIRHLH